MLPGDPCLSKEIWAKELAEAGCYVGDIITPTGKVINPYRIKSVDFQAAKQFCLELGALEAAAYF